MRHVPYCAVSVEKAEKENCYNATQPQNSMDRFRRRLTRSSDHYLIRSIGLYDTTAPVTIDTILDWNAVCGDKPPKWTKALQREHGVSMKTLALEYLKAIGLGEDVIPPSGTFTLNSRIYIADPGATVITLPPPNSIATPNYLGRLILTVTSSIATSHSNLEAVTLTKTKESLLRSSGYTVMAVFLPGGNDNGLTIKPPSSGKIVTCVADLYATGINYDAVRRRSTTTMYPSTFCDDEDW